MGPFSRSSLRDEFATNDGSRGGGRLSSEERRGRSEELPDGEQPMAHERYFEEPDSVRVDAERRELEDPTDFSREPTALATHFAMGVIGHE
jgi:hypothetical protein